ncbi:MAG TPA: hypothetical protein VEK83_01115 [Gemmatimonadales bacterium]|nr:hypothetical protein [Gemmatimonadales bacterium]
MTTVRVYGKAAKPAGGSPLLAGLLAAIGIIVAWVGLVYVTHHPVGVAAWGVGGLLGIVVAKTAKPPTKATGALATVLTLVTVFLAKVVLVVVALQPILRQELANSPASLILIFLAEKTQHKSFSPELQATIDTRPDLVADTTFFGPGHALRQQMIHEAATAAQASSFAERERLVHVPLRPVLVEAGILGSVPGDLRTAGSAVDRARYVDRLDPRTGTDLS